MCSGTSPDDRLVEFIELPRRVHPFFVATQAHPEFKSRPDRPHPLFAAFVAGGARAGRGPRAAAADRGAGAGRARCARRRWPTSPRSGSSASSTVARRRVPRASTDSHVEGRDGEVHERYVVRHPGAVVVVPVERRRHTCCSCASTGPRSTATCSSSPPASATSTASRPRRTAHRELDEEIGPARRAGSNAGRVLQHARLLRRVHLPLRRVRPRATLERAHVQTAEEAAMTDRARSRSPTCDRLIADA